MIRGTITARKTGETTTMTIMVLMTEKNVDRKLSSDWGIISSMVSMSFEKRFRIRPRGVVSKKDMGDRRMQLSMPL